MSQRHAHLHKGRWEATRRECFQRDKWRCTRCGKAGMLEAHHQDWQPGDDPYDVAKIATLCRSCHIQHHREDRRNPPSQAEVDWQCLVEEIAAESDPGGGQDAQNG